MTLDVTRLVVSLGSPQLGLSIHGMVATRHVSAKGYTACNRPEVSTKQYKPNYHRGKTLLYKRGVPSRGVDYWLSVFWGTTATCPLESGGVPQTRQAPPSGAISMVLVKEMQPVSQERSPCLATFRKTMLWSYCRHRGQRPSKWRSSWIATMTPLEAPGAL